MKNRFFYIFGCRYKQEGGSHAAVCEYNHFARPEPAARSRQRAHSDAFGKAIANHAGGKGLVSPDLVAVPHGPHGLDEESGAAAGNGASVVTMVHHLKGEIATSPDTGTKKIEAYAEKVAQKAEGCGGLGAATATVAKQVAGSIKNGTFNGDSSRIALTDSVQDHKVDNSAKLNAGVIEKEVKGGDFQEARSNVAAFKTETGSKHGLGVATNFLQAKAKFTKEIAADGTSGKDVIDASDALGEAAGNLGGKIGGTFQQFAHNTGASVVNGSFNKQATLDAKRDANKGKLIENSEGHNAGIIEREVRSGDMTDAKHNLQALEKESAPGQGD